MKRFLAALSILALLLGICACGNGADTAPAKAGKSAGFQVGFGRVDITPIDDPVPLSGYGNTSKRISNGFYDFMYSTCIAITDAEGQTVLLLHNDLITADEVLVKDARKAINEATGVPESHIMICATHSHSAPDLFNAEVPSSRRYYNSVVDWMAEAAAAAMADRKIATAEIASTPTEGLNFVRHYFMNDGSVVAENHKLQNGNTYDRHCHDADNQMQLIRFQREKGKDVVLVNWQAHPTRYGNSTSAGPDFIGPLRTRLEDKLDCQMAYFTGAAGNLNMGSRIPNELATDDYEKAGQMLADYAIAALKEPTKVNTGAVQVLVQDYTAAIDKSEDYLVSVARSVSELCNGASTDEGMAIANQYGLNSPWHASGIIKRAGAQDHTIELAAVAIGDVSFIVAPYEMFDQNGKQIKSDTPFAMTFVCCYGNGANGYIASRECAEHGCYGFDTRYYAVGAGEDLAETYLSMLNTLFK